MATDREMLEFVITNPDLQFAHSDKWGWFCMDCRFGLETKFKGSASLDEVIVKAMEMKKKEQENAH